MVWRPFFFLGDEQTLAPPLHTREPITRGRVACGAVEAKMDGEKKAKRWD